MINQQLRPYHRQQKLMLDLVLLHVSACAFDPIPMWTPKTNRASTKPGFSGWNCVFRRKG